MEVHLGGLNMYTDDIWRRLPEDKAIFREKRENPLSETMFDQIGRIFIKHNVHKDFSLYLNRRHFDLEPGESLVECGAIATPWPLREVDDALKDKIAAKSWAFFDDKLLPFEFSFDPEVKRPQHNVVPSLFIDELGGFLRTHNLAGQFGITKMDPSISLEESRSMIETNIGRVSVLVPKNDLEGGVANVGWQFDLDGNKVVRGCKYCCSVHG